MKRTPVLVGALSFALLAAVVAATMQTLVQVTETRIGSANGMSWEELQDAVDSKLKTLTEADALRVAARFRDMPETGEIVKPDDAAIAFIAAIGPWLLLSFFVDLLIFWLACVYFLLTATGGLQTGYESLQRLPGMFFPMIGLTIWFSVRTLIWLPFIGLLIAAYLGPRFILSPVILASGEAGVFHSLHESLRRTSGRWAVIALNLLALVALCIAIWWIGLILIAVLSLFSLKLGLFVWLFLVMCTAAFCMFFLTMLTALLS